MLGVNLAVATPTRYRPDRGIWEQARQSARKHGGSLRWEEDPREAARGAQVVYTDVWISMGQERERAARRQAFGRYQLNPTLLKRASVDCRIMHCLPAHRGEEITEEVMESSGSVIFDQAENRLHVHKAILVFLMTKRKKHTR